MVLSESTLPASRGVDASGTYYFALLGRRVDHFL